MRLRLKVILLDGPWNRWQSGLCFNTALCLETLEVRNSWLGILFFLPFCDLTLNEDFQSELVKDHRPSKKLGFQRLVSTDASGWPVTPRRFVFPLIVLCRKGFSGAKLHRLYHTRPRLDFPFDRRSVVDPAASHSWVIIIHFCCSISSWDRACSKCSRVNILSGDGCCAP